jgi:hypothetical protein
VHLAVKACRGNNTENKEQLSTGQISNEDPEPN